jgi:hypothetical protein
MGINPMATPMTVRELIAELQTHDPDQFVMIKCEDDYYDCPITPDSLAVGRAQLVAPHECSVPFETRDTLYDSGGWRPRDPAYDGDDPDRPEYTRDVVEERPCLLIYAHA